MRYNPASVTEANICVRINVNYLERNRKLAFLDPSFPCPESPVVINDLLSY